MGEMEDEFHFVLVWIFVKNTLSLTIIENPPSLNLYNCSAKTTLNLPINYFNTLLKPHITENNLSADVIVMMFIFKSQYIIVRFSL